MNSLVLILSALSFVVALAAAGRGYYQCTPCRGEECTVQPEGCRHGKAQDVCGRWRCMSGPGERCGGRDNFFGKCGDGMTCDCSKCVGCSTTLLKETGILECTKKSRPLCD